jgi:hypothetical protein
MGKHSTTRKLHMKLICLTIQGHPMAINPDRVAAVLPAMGGTNPSGTNLWFSGAEDDYIHADEPFDEVVRLLRGE